MADITVRKDNGRTAPAPSTNDPFRIMRDWLRWDPFAEMMPMRDEKITFAPAFEVKESKEGYTFRADVPGLLEKDLEIHLAGNRLTISGKRDAEVEDKGDTFFVYERTYGSFARSFTLPVGVDADHIRAELKDGVLTVALPKKPELQPKKIAISVEKTKS